MKERQIDIGMTLDEKILDYLEREDDYRSPECIAEVLKEPLREIETRCMALYWDPKNGLSRTTSVADRGVVYRKSPE